MKHKCPIDGCPELVVPDKLMCAAHWKHVPRVLQRMVYGAWYRRQGTNDARVDVAAHETICRDAIETVNAQVKRPQLN